MSTAGSSDPKTASNPSLGSSSKGGSTHRVPGGFVPPSAEIARGVPKGASAKGKSSLLPLAIGTVVLLAAGGGAAFYLSQSSTSPTVAAAPITAPQDAVAAADSPAPTPTSPDQAKLPTWVPEYLSGARTAGTSNKMGGELQGTIQYKTTNSPESVIKYYQDAVKPKGLVITALTLTSGSSVLEAKSKDGVRKLIVMAQASAEGAQASVVFTTMDPDKTKPIAGAALPDFLPLFQGGKRVEQTTRTKDGAVFGFVKFTVKTPLGPLLDFYAAQLVAAHYEVERIERAGFGKLAGKSLKTDPPANVFVEEKEGQLEVLLQLLEKTGP